MDTMISETHFLPSSVYAFPGYKRDKSPFSVMNEILQTVMKYYHIGEDDMARVPSNKHVKLVLHIARYLTRIKSKYTLMLIADFYSVDHTTIINSVHTVKDLMFSNPQIKIDIQKINDLL